MGQTQNTIHYFHSCIDWQWTIVLKIIPVELNWKIIPDIYSYSIENGRKYNTYSITVQVIAEARLDLSFSNAIHKYEYCIGM